MRFTALESVGRWQASCVFDCLPARPVSHDCGIVLSSFHFESTCLHTQVQLTKQGIEMLKASLPSSGIKPYRPEVSTVPTRITSRWSQDELLLAAQGTSERGNPRT